MELKDIIYKRQSVREYTDAEIPKEDILKILDAGRVAPSGKNCQNWHFVVIRERDLRNKIGQAILDKNEEIAVEMDRKDPEKGLRFRKFVRRFTLFGMEAPVLIAVYATEYKPDGWAELTFAEYPQDVIDELNIRNPGMQSIGAAVENMTLTAIDLGYGSCWMSGHSYAAGDIEAVIKQETGFEKENYFLACLLPIGVPAGERKSPAKNELEEICTFV
jgi:nitroreductase